MKIVKILAVILVISLFGAFSCAQGVSQEEYDKVSDELNTMKTQLESLQDELEMLEIENEQLTREYDTFKSERDALQIEYEELDVEYEELNEQYDIVKNEYDIMQIEHDILTAEYEELSEKYTAIIEESKAVVSEEDLEQALFELVNQERLDNGLEELIWGEYMYKTANQNNLNMAKNKRIEYDERAAYQDVYRATGYTNTEKMAEAIFTIWKNTENYELKFLNSVMIYGTVAVYKSGEIYYITYISDYYK